VALTGSYQTLRSIRLSYPKLHFAPLLVTCANENRSIVPLPCLIESRQKTCDQYERARPSWHGMKSRNKNESNTQPDMTSSLRKHRQKKLANSIWFSMPYICVLSLRHDNRSSRYRLVSRHTSVSAAESSLDPKERQVPATSYPSATQVFSA
jgi:hypothetical protein